MMKYFIHLSYNGTKYSGYQWQSVTPNTIEQTLQSSLKYILKVDNIAITGCGRTDAGVHAAQYFIQFVTESSLRKELFLLKLNNHLPEDIVCYDIFPVPDNGHTRYDAVSREYNFFIHTSKDPFINNLSMYVYGTLNVEAMKQATGLISHYNDFRSLCKSPDKHNTTICHITNAQLLANSSEDRIQFSITANRFLKSMIRIIVGQLIQIGKGKISIKDFEYRLAGNTPNKQYELAHPCGLYLTRIEYPDFKFPIKSETFTSLNLKK